LDYSFKLLALRARSRWEIESRLKLKKHPARIVTRVRDHLLARGFLDDSNFSRMYIAYCCGKGWGRRRIEAGFRRSGVAKEVYQGFLPGKAETREKLRELIARKSAYYEGKKNAYQKLVRFLAGRGFESEEILRELEGFKT